MNSPRDVRKLVKWENVHIKKSKRKKARTHVHHPLPPNHPTHHPCSNPLTAIHSRVPSIFDSPWHPFFSPWQSKKQKKRHGSCLKLASPRARQHIQLRTTEIRVLR